MGSGSGANDPRRRRARHKTDSLSCPLGEVVDLSGAGVRLSCKGKPPIAIGQITTIKLRFADGAISLQGQAMWVRKSKFRTYEIGLRFVQLKPGADRALDMIAQFGFIGGNSSAKRSSTTSSRAQGKTKIQATVDLPDYYSVLGVQFGASQDDIKSAFRKLASRLHPDIAGDVPDAAEKFSQVCDAYEVLKDTEKRAMYDLRSAA